MYMSNEQSVSEPCLLFSALYSKCTNQHVAQPHSSMSALDGAVEFPHTQGCLYNYVHVCYLFVCLCVPK